jgi:hypothetical protein
VSAVSGARTIAMRGYVVSREEAMAEFKRYWDAGIEAE